MDQRLISTEENVSSQFKIQAKTLIISFYAISLIVLVSALCCLISSANLSKTYLGGLQITIIIAASFCIVFLIGATYSLKIIKDTAQKVVLFSLGAYIMQTIMVSIGLVSLLLTLLQIYCGEFVTHGGVVDGTYIVTQMQTNYNYPSCSSMESNASSVQNQVYVVATSIIMLYCGQGNSDCTQLNTLQVSDWSSQFGVQLAGVIIGGVVNILYLIVVVMVRQRIKKIRDSTNQTLTLLQQQQMNQNQQNPVYVVVPTQPVQQYPQQFQPAMPQYPPNNYQQPYPQPLYPNYEGVQNNQQYINQQNPPHMMAGQNQQPFRQNQYI